MLEYFFSGMKAAGTWPKDLTYTKCADFSGAEPIQRPDLDLRQALKSVRKAQNNYFHQKNILILKITRLGCLPPVLDH